MTLLRILAQILSNVLPVNVLEGADQGLNQISKLEEGTFSIQALGKLIESEEDQTIISIQEIIEIETTEIDKEKHKIVVEKDLLRRLLLKMTYLNKIMSKTLLQKVQDNKHQLFKLQLKVYCKHFCIKLKKRKECQIHPI